MNDGIDVVIPARNEQDTIANIMAVFRDHPAIRRTYLVIDKDTTDNTASHALSAINLDSALIISPNISGKGQLVKVGLELVESSYVIFCDADITGLTEDHIGLLIADAMQDNFMPELSSPTMTIGVPDVPANYPKDRLWAWPWVSGERCVPTALVRPLMLHGYLMETQINLAARHADMSVRFEWLRGLKSEYDMNERRLAELYRDGAYGRKTGILLEASEYVDEKRDMP